MIKLEDSQIANILPGALKEMPEVQAISYAINKAIRKLNQYAKTTSVYAIIDDLPENILDLLAAELRTQYYDESVDIETKRQIVKNTLNWYHKAGTPAAVRELIKSILGNGEIIEWFEYGGEPYRFKIATNSVMEEDAIKKMEKLIGKVKNVRSHLEAIELIRMAETKTYIAAATVVHGRSVIKEEGV